MEEHQVALSNRKCSLKTHPDIYLEPERKNGKMDYNQHQQFTKGRIKTKNTKKYHFLSVMLIFFHETLSKYFLPCFLLQREE